MRTPITLVTNVGISLLSHITYHIPVNRNTNETKITSRIVYRAHRAAGISNLKNKSSMSLFGKPESRKTPNAEFAKP